MINAMVNVQSVTAMCARPHWCVFVMNVLSVITKTNVLYVVVRLVNFFLQPSSGDAYFYSI